jgi:Nucleoside-diphosphate-sugar epimerases
MKILITGATGFIGEWVMNELKRSEHSAIAFSGDIRDKNTFPKGAFDAIIHLAAIITHREQYSLKDMIEVNIEGTKNICEVYSESKIVYISTTDVTKQPLSDYAMTKLESEKIVKMQQNYVIMRLPSVFGPHQRQAKLIPLLFRKYTENAECTIFNNDLREYIFVKTLARQIVEGIDQVGVITISGIKIRNFDVDKMIHAICEHREISGLTPKEKEFFLNLKECFPRQGESHEN